MLVVGFLIVVTGVDPIQVTEYSVIFSVVALPLTYVPILLVANDRAYMGRFANGRIANVFGIVYLVVMLVISVAAIPLMISPTWGRDERAIDLGLGLVDHQLVDWEGRRCGKVDDLELEGREGRPQVAAILVGRRRAVHVACSAASPRGRARRGRPRSVGRGGGGRLRRASADRGGAQARAGRRPGSELVAWIPGAR